jgi:hypothetical protein
MAHQCAHQVLKARNEPAHGQAFMKACYLLRANPKASGSYPLLQEKVFHGAIDSNDKMLLRIKKLLALAESQNRHEAESAMIKAHELIAKHNVDWLSFQRKRNFFSLFLGKPSLRHRREIYHLARLVQDFYYVRGIWVPAYVMEKGKMGRVLEISGTPHNIAMAEYVYDFVLRFIQSQWMSYNENKGLNQYRRTDYAVGIIEGFREKLNGQHAKQKSAQKPFEIIALGDPQLNEYIEHRYPHTKRFCRAVSSQDEFVRNDGMEAGRKLVIYQGISEKQTRKPPLRLIHQNSG